MRTIAFFCEISCGYLFKPTILAKQSIFTKFLYRNFATICSKIFRNILFNGSKLLFRCENGHPFSKGLVEDKAILGGKEAVGVATELVGVVLVSPNALLRYAAADCMGRLAQVVGDHKVSA
jgi:hypothetical protein